MVALIVGLFLSMGAFAQISVKGHVKDATGEAVIGATIRVVGTQVATISDFDGNFTLNANQGADLQVSYMGYQTATVKAASNVVVTLQEDAAVLNDVVVIGYGRAKKSDLTGSVTAIKPDEMNHGLQTSAQDMLQGKIAGVNVTSYGGEPGVGAQIRIRGGSSLNASNDPLIVIDGLAMSNDSRTGSPNALSTINPNDIESFTVLKSASATAIYGSRGSNGVIIITTKKGRAGAKALPKVTYNGNVSISVKKKSFDVLDGPSYMKLIEDTYGQGSSEYGMLGYLDANGNKQYANTDWQDEIFRTAVSNDHNITLTGAIKNVPYRVSLGATSQNGILKTSNYSRFTGSISLSPSLLQDHLKLNINGKVMYSKTRFADTGAIGSARWMDPTKAVTSDNEIYQKYFGGYVQWYKNADYAGDTEWAQMWNDKATPNPLAQLNLRNNIGRTRDFVGNVEADYSIHGFEDLHLHINAGADYTFGKSNDTRSPYGTGAYYYGYEGWNKQKLYNLQFTAYAQYIKELNKANHFDIMAGYEYQKYHENTDYNNFGIYPSSSPNAGQKYNEPAAEVERVYKTEHYIVSFYGRLNYSLLDRYLLTLTLRDDGSSRFKNHWGLFPSAAFAWKMKEESFLRNVDWLSDAKLRLDYGVTGQQDGIGDYYYLPVYTPSVDHAYYPIVGDGRTLSPDAYNDDLKWERTTTYNVGVDFGLWRDRVVLNFDWYYRKTTDLINSVFVETGSNFRNKVTQNIGDLHNEGIEVGLTLRPIQAKNLSWELNYNFTYNKNVIDKLVSASPETGDNIAGGTGGKIQANYEGKAINSFNVYQQVYDQNGNPIQNMFVDRNGSGSIESGDRYAYYKPAPDVTMGLGSKFIYKNWDLGFNMRAFLGNYVFNNAESSAINLGKGAISTLNYLGNRTTNAVALGFTNPQTTQFMSDYFVQNASFLKLDNVTLGYNFAKILDANISGRIYATVQNVFTISKYDGLDPEVSNGIDNTLYPRPITTVIGLNLNF